MNDNCVCFLPQNNNNFEITELLLTGKRTKRKIRKKIKIMINLFYLINYYSLNKLCIL